MTTLPQQQALAIIPKISSTCSMIGSTLLARHVLLRQLQLFQKTNRPNRRTSNSSVSSTAGRRKQPSGVFSRLLLGLSVVDFATSAAYFCSTWPMPSTTRHIWGTVGNTTTCTIQGFFVQHGLSAACYNACIGLYIVLKTSYSWKEEELQKYKMEPIMHAISLSVGFGTAVAGVALKLYNPVVFSCWMGGSPLGCTPTMWQTTSSEDTSVLQCTRGDNAHLYRNYLFFFPLFGCILLCLTCLLLLFQTMRKQEQAMDRYQFRNGGRFCRSHSRHVAKQGMWYLGAFFAVFTFPILLQILNLVERTRSGTHFWIWLLSAICTPSQGVWNALIYLHPKAKRSVGCDSGLWCCFEKPKETQVPRAKNPRAVANSLERVEQGTKKETLLSEKEIPCAAEASESESACSSQEKADVSGFCA